MSALTWSCVLSALSLLALGLSVYLTIHVYNIETDLSATALKVNEHTVLILTNGQKLGRLESIAISNSQKLKQLIEENNQCHAHYLRIEGKP